MDNIIQDKYTRIDGESTYHYELRCYNQKFQDDDISWYNLATIMNRELGESHWESYYRKRSKKFLVLDETNKVYQNEQDEYTKTLLELKKARVKLSEERIQNNAYIRRLAREETIKEIAHDFAEVMSSKKILNSNSSNKNANILYSNTMGILMLSDWHYGMEIDNPFNSYNDEIFADRVYSLISQAKDIVLEKGIKELHVVNLSDLISGRIHLTIRLQSREDVISQVMHVAETLAEMLTELSEITKVVYHDVLDNHSRLEPVKGDSLDLESLARIIPWYLKERLSDNNRIIIDNKSTATDIAAFTVGNFKVAAVHGHKDKPRKVIDNMMHMLGEKHDLVLTAHLHHFACEEEHECLRVSNGTNQVALYIY